MPVVIHKCVFPKTVKDQKEVWAVYNWLKLKLGGKKHAPDLPIIIKDLSNNWDKHFQDYCLDQNSNLFVNTNIKNQTAKLLTSNSTERKIRDTMAIGKFKQSLLSFIDTNKSQNEIIEFIKNYQHF